MRTKAWHNYYFTKTKKSVWRKKGLQLLYSTVALIQRSSWNSRWRGTKTFLIWRNKDEGNWQGRNATFRSFRYASRKTQLVVKQHSEMKKSACPNLCWRPVLSLFSYTLMIWEFLWTMSQGGLRVLDGMAHLTWECATSRGWTGPTIIQFNSILIYLHANSAAQGPLTKWAWVKETYKNQSYQLEVMVIMIQLN
jgi:hypothetical protein